MDELPHYRGLDSAEGQVTGEMTWPDESVAQDLPWRDLRRRGAAAAWFAAGCLILSALGALPIAGVWVATDGPKFLANANAAPAVFFSFFLFGIGMLGAAAGCFARSAAK